MDIILIIIFIIGCLVFLSLYISFWWTLLLLLIYFLIKYFDGNEYTGFRVSSWLRRHKFNTSIKYWLKNKEDLYGDRMLFVVMGNFTNLSLMSAFGLHGGFFDKVDLVYLMPPILFKIPFLRDILLWTGAVTWKDNNCEQTIINLFHKGKCVVYPIQSDDLLKYMGNAEEVSVSTPNKELIDFVSSHPNIHVVPVLIQNETKRYGIWKFPRLLKITRYCQEKWGWPFPFMFCPRICGKEPPPKVNVHIGSPMKSHDNFRTVFLGNFEGLFLLSNDDELNEVILK